MNKRQRLIAGLLIALPFIVISYLSGKVAPYDRAELSRFGHATVAGSAPEVRTLQIKELYDLPYYEGPDADSLKHSLNLFIPENVENPPLFLWLHGGAWAFGGRTTETPLARKFAGAGIAVAAVSYRLSPATWGPHNKVNGIQHPEHMKDVAKAFSWLYEKSDSFGYDKHSIFVGGYSAGAHLSALLSLDPRYLNDVGRSVQDIKGAIPIAGAYDIEEYYQAHLKFNGKDFADKHVKGVFGESMSALQEASPSEYLENEWVPMLVISERDTYEYTRIFQAGAEACKNRVINFSHIRDMDHKGLLKDLSTSANSVHRDQIISYIFQQRNRYQFINRPDGVIAYRVYGHGKPLFLVNGGPGYASHHFDMLATQLGEKYQVVIFDQRGTGYSDLSSVDANSITLKKMVEDMEALRVALGFEKINILGHSFGGMYASLYASEHPENVEKLILSHSGGFTMDFTKEFSARLNSQLISEEKTILKSIPFSSTFPNDRKARLKALAPAYVSKREYADRVYKGLTFRANFNPRINTLVYQDLVRIKYDLTRFMATFYSPVLILHGLYDIVDPQTARDAHAILPRSELVLLDSGHYGWIEQPETYFLKVDMFLNS